MCVCCRGLSGVWEEMTTAFYPSTTWSIKHLSTRNQPHRAARCHNSIWTTLWCAATSNYLLGGLSAVGAVCGVVMAWGLAGAFSGWGLVVLPCHSSSRFCSAGPLVWCPCKSGAALWPIDFALVDFLCTPVALAKQSLSFLKNPMGC